MKSACAFITIAGLVGTIFFGGYAMHSAGSHVSGCVANTVFGNSECPTDGMTAALLFHLDALRVFTTAIIGAGFAFGLGAAILIFCYPITRTRLAERGFSTRLFRDISFAPIPIRSRYVAWLSLHENSPAFS